LTPRQLTWRRLRPLVIVILVLVAIPPLVSLTGAADKRDRTYKKRSLEGRRVLDLQYERDYQYEATFEKCEIQSIESLAAGLGVQPTPEIVARAYARKHEPSVREVVYRGCRDAYLGRWAPPSEPGSSKAPPPEPQQPRPDFQQ
jgi:hypothetical protein